MLLLALFVNFYCKCAGNGSKKWKILMCVRIYLGNHERVCITKSLKSLHPTVYVQYINCSLPKNYFLNITNGKRGAKLARARIFKLLCIPGIDSTEFLKGGGGRSLMLNAKIGSGRNFHTAISLWSNKINMLKPCVFSAVGHLGPTVVDWSSLFYTQCLHHHLTRSRN